MSSYNYFFFIYSCKKYIKKASLIYDLLIDKLPDCKIYIIYGNPELSDYEIVDDKYIVLNVEDHYENLTDKTLCLLKTTMSLNPNIKGIFKCDDDIIPNVSYLLNTLELLHKTPIEYMGLVINVNPHESTWHYGKCSSSYYNNKIFIPKCTYATGPIYYLGNNAIEKICNSTIEKYFSEDVTIGYNLEKYCITPINVQMYKNSIKDIFSNNFQNINASKKTLMVRLHGGLGNQLFQASAGYYLAKKYSFILVLVYSSNLKYTHGEEFSKTIFNKFNVVINDNISYFDKCIPLNEPNNNKACFEYYGENIIGQYENHFLTGYFINKTYVENAGKDFIELLQNNSLCKKLNTDYKDLETSYFIHIRRGDYVNHKLYMIDYDTYFIKAIEYIKQTDKSPHFYILSDDIAFCKTYNVLNDINKTFIENMDTLHSLYFMSLCKKGGICSNSTFSGWATNLNNNPNKVVIFPKKWINTPNHVNIPFDYTATL